MYEARQRASSAADVLWDLKHRIDEVQLVQELVRMNYVDRREMVQLWVWLLDRNTLAPDLMESVDVRRAIQEDKRLIRELTDDLLKKDVIDPDYIQAHQIVIQIPDLFRSIYEQADEPRKKQLGNNIFARLIERYFEALRYSPYNRIALNTMAEVFTHNLLNFMRGSRTLMLDYGLSTNFKTQEQKNERDIFDQFDLERLFTYVKDLGIEVQDEQSLVAQINLDHLAYMLVYSMEGLHSVSDLEETVVDFIDKNSEFKHILVKNILNGLMNETRYSPQYQNALKLALLDPGIGRDIIDQVKRQELTDNQKLVFDIDLTNIVVEQRFNELLIGHADLILGQQAGKGLFSLSKKMQGHFNPVTLTDIQQDLKKYDLNFSNEFVESSLDPLRYRVWGSAVIPRISILRNGYRGSRTFDDPDARYVTRAATVAMRYAWSGGEVSAAQGERVIHQWSFPNLLENMIVASVNEEDVRTTVKINKVDQFHIEIKQNQMKVIDEVSDIEKILPLPEEGEIRVVKLLKAEPLLNENPYYTVQIGRIDGQIYVLRIDPNVALANSLLDPPSSRAYVRQVSTEGLSDYDVMRKLIRVQVIEQSLKEEILDAVDRMYHSTSAEEFTWAVRTIYAALQDLDPRREHINGDRDIAGLSESYFDDTYGLFYERLRSILDNWLDQDGVIQREKISEVRDFIKESKEIALLKEEEASLEDSFESFDRTLNLDRYRGMIKNRRTVANRFLELLRTHPKPSALVRHLYKMGDLDYFLDEFSALRDVEQGSFHKWINADEHSLRVLDEMDGLIESKEFSSSHPEFLRLLALLHDVGKGEGRHGHSKRGAQAMRGLLESIQIPEPMIERLANIVELHTYMGEIAATNVRRLTKGWKRGEIEPLRFQARQEARIQFLAQNIKGERSVEQALEDLRSLYMITIADTKATEFYEGDTGNRYTTVFARELKKVMEGLKRVIKNEQSSLALDVKVNGQYREVIFPRRNVITVGSDLPSIIENIAVQFPMLGVSLYDGKSIHPEVIIKVDGQEIAHSDIFDFELTPESRVSIEPSEEWDPNQGEPGDQPPPLDESGEQPGGIDFQPMVNDLRIQGESSPISTPNSLPIQPIGNFNLNFDGLVPVILKITPILQIPS